MGYAKEKEKISMPRSMGKRKKEKEKENKDSPYLKIKDRVMQKKVRVSSRKIPHTCTS